MGKKEKKIQRDNNNQVKKKESILTLRTKKWIKAIVIFLIAIICSLSFLGKAGIAGELFVKLSKILFGDSRVTVTTIVLSLFASGFILLQSHKKVKILALILAIIITVVGFSGISANQNLNGDQIGLIGWLAKLLVSFFGLLVSNIIFFTTIVIGLFIFLQFIWHEIPKEKEEKKPEVAFPIKSTDSPNLKITGVQEQKPEQPRLAPKVSLLD